jgi:hypothetical protein
VFTSNVLEYIAYHLWISENEVAFSFSRYSKAVARSALLIQQWPNNPDLLVGGDRDAETLVGRKGAIRDWVNISPSGEGHLSGMR